MKAFFDGNRNLWNQWTKIHVNSDFYDVASFIKGKNTIDPFELDEVGPVGGKTLLHLQCHFGLTTLSWARLGAVVTGVDLAGEAIKTANQLAGQIKQPAAFIESNVYDLPAKLETQFDIVYTSFGVLNWLPDLTRWAQICFDYVKPGGFLYLAEYHPFTWVFDEKNPDQLEVGYDYFDQEVLIEPIVGSYADPVAVINQKESYEWAHPMGEVLTSLIQAGFQLEFVHEFDFSNYKRYPFLMRNEAGMWVMPEGKARIPLMFSVRANK
jgi:SAM-dependent methyltransferase